MYLTSKACFYVHTMEYMEYRQKWRSKGGRGDTIKGIVAITYYIGAKMVSCIIAVLLQEMFVYGLTYWPVRIEPLLHLYGNLQSRDFSDIYGKSIIGHQTKGRYTF